MSGIVYLFTNPAMPGLVKIGKTSGNSPLIRMSQLSRDTGVPLPFECELAMEVDDAFATEKAFHQAFAPNRINKRREFSKSKWRRQKRCCVWWVKEMSHQK